MVIEPQGWAVITILASALAGLLGAWAISIKLSATTHSYQAKNESDSDKALKDAQIDAQKTFIRIADRFVAGQDSFVKLVTDNINANNQNADVMRGMLLMMDGHGKLLRETALAVDDVNAGIAGISKVTETLQTDIEGSLTGQIGPVVIAIQGIGKQLDTLNVTLQSKDETTLKLMEHLQFSFGALETTLLKMLEPIALRTLGELHEKHAENGNVSPAAPAAE